MTPENTESTQDQEVALRSKTELANVENALANFDDEFGIEVAKELQSEAAFLPYIRMIQGDCKYKDPPYDLTDGEFTMHPNKNDVTALGKEIDLMFVTWRPLAMNFTGKKPMGTTDQHSEEFTAWRLRAEAKTEEERRGYQWGYEFLCWLPSVGQFVTFWLSNPSGRRFARYEIIGTKSKAPKLREKLTLWAEKIVDEQETATRRYWVFKTIPCNSAFAMPDLAELNEVTIKFKEGRTLQANDSDGVETDAAGEDTTVR